MVELIGIAPLFLRKCVFFRRDFDQNSIRGHNFERNSYREGATEASRALLGQTTHGKLRLSLAKEPYPFARAEVP